MPIAIRCACGRDLHVKDEFAGHKVRCPQCKEPLIVPEPEAAPASEEDAAEMLLDSSTEPPKPLRLGPSDLRAPPPSPDDTHVTETKKRAWKAKAKKERPPRQPQAPLQKGWFDRIFGSMFKRRGKRG